jgi:hypothetical protein
MEGKHVFRWMIERQIDTAKAQQWDLSLWESMLSGVITMTAPNQPWGHQDWAIAARHEIMRQIERLRKALLTSH